MAGNVFDVAVLGLGSMGAFACRELARRGLSVLGLEQFAPPHDRGSHSGETRVFRIAYAEHPDYVPLAQRASVLWDELGERAGATLLHRSGLLSMGPEDGALIMGAQASAAIHSLALETLSGTEIRRRYPMFTAPRDWVAVFEPAAGWLDVDAALRFALGDAARAGAQLELNAKVEAWEPQEEHYRVTTAAGSYQARRLVITAGAWSGELLRDLGIPLRVIRKWLVWVNPLRPELFQSGTMPIFASAAEFFYGFPTTAAQQAVKLAIHWSDLTTPADPDQFEADAPPQEQERILAAAASLLPDLAGPMPGARSRVVRSKTCLYTMTPDEHFIIDAHPQCDGVYFAAGFSGHGFKFAPAIGEALADMAMTGTTTLPVGFLRMERLGMQHQTSIARTPGLATDN